MGKENISLYKKVWCRIRYWQSLYDISDSTLAEYLNVCERTLRDYDKNAKNITLEKVNNFLDSCNIGFDDLMDI